MATDVFRVETKGVTSRLRALASLGGLPSEVAVALNEVADETILDAKEHTPVSPGGGRLRASGHVSQYAEAHSLRAELAYGTDYACVFGAGTSVVTDGGPTGIGRIRVGAKVLTQTGEFRRVLATSRLPAGLKPEMVDITANWRAGHDHRLTITTDHKVLVLRDGRRLWVPAGLLTVQDQVFRRAKLAHNKGRRAYTVVCSQCGVTFASSNSGRWSSKRYRYCSMACRNLGYAGEKHPSRGKPRDTAPARAGLAAKIRREGGGTEDERSVERWLLARGVAYAREVRIGKHWVDFFLASENLVIEADGAYWHQDQRRDIERDQAIMAAGPAGMRIVHLHFYHERFSPKPLDERPLPGVFYVSCNPGPETYVNPEVFEPTPITSLRRWEYCRRAGMGKGAGLEGVYNLTVDAVRSFVASGIVVSNCYVHEIPPPPDKSPGGRSARHRIGEWKFLENAVNRTGQNLVTRLAAKLRSLRGGA